MAAFTDFSENKIIDWFFRAQALGITGASAAAGTGPTTLWIGLLTATPTDATAGTEVTGGSYARQAVTSSLTAWAGTQAAASTTASTGTSATTSNNNVITFPVPTANWGVVAGMGIYDAVTGGNLCIYNALTVSKTINNADAAPTFPAGSLTFTLDN
jgi:hypothetical protein